MINTELFRTRKDGVKLLRTYSDAGVKIKQDQTGIIYDDAIDVEGSPYTYTETYIPLDGDAE